MTTKEKCTKRFVSDSLTIKKYNELLSYGMFLRDYRNLISSEISKDPFKYVHLTGFDFLTLMRKQHYHEISSSFDKFLYQQVFNAYQDRFKKLKKNLTIKRRVFSGFLFYKKNVNGHKKGELKKVIFDETPSELSIALTYLSRYGSENIIEYIKNNKDTSKAKQEFYKSILRLVDKFGFKRLYDLALSHRTRVIRRSFQTPIKFTSINYGGRSRRPGIIGFNSNFNSKIKAFISLSWNGRESMEIPVKYSKSYHGLIKDYSKSYSDYFFTISFNEKKKQITIGLCKDVEYEWPEVNDNSPIIGVDVNIKNNLFCTSSGHTYMYDEKLVSDYCELCLKLDGLKKDNKEYKVGKKKRLKLNCLKTKIRKNEANVISSMCKDLKTSGIKHIVMEDLEQTFHKTFAKHETYGINYNRIVTFLRIVSLKDVVKRTARKYGIALSKVHKYYTSKMCPICGCIDDENRPNQENFECVDCGYKSNADINAAKNIRNRVLVTVLRDKLLKMNDDGTFTPKPLEMEYVKKVLLSQRANYRDIIEKVT